MYKFCAAKSSHVESHRVPPMIIKRQRGVWSKEKLCGTIWLTTRFSLAVLPSTYILPSVWKKTEKWVDFYFLFILYILLNCYTQSFSSNNGRSWGSTQSFLWWRRSDSGQSSLYACKFKKHMSRKVTGGASASASTKVMC